MKKLIGVLTGVVIIGALCLMLINKKPEDVQVMSYVEAEGVSETESPSSMPTQILEPTVAPTPEPAVEPTPDPSPTPEVEVKAIKEAEEAVIEVAKPTATPKATEKPVEIVKPTSAPQQSSGGSSQSDQDFINSLGGDTLGSVTQGNATDINDGGHGAIFQ